MKIAYHLTVPRPPHPELDAAVQDVMKLLGSVDGVINYLYPGKEVKRWLPRVLSGLHQILYLLRLDSRVDVHHIFSNGLYPYPILLLLRKPIVCTSVIGVGSISFGTGIFLKRLFKKVIVSAPSDVATLDSLGFESEFLYPGIELDRFSLNKVASQKEFTLLVGSAPWTEDQFSSKGVDLVLQACGQLPWLRLVFLWRGKLLSEMHEKVEKYGVADRVHIIAEQVNVDTVLKDVHAALILVDDSNVIKSFPHSLLESLAAGKPVIVSAIVPIADFVEQNNCGVCVECFEIECLVNSVKEMKDQYDVFLENVSKVDMNVFSSERMVNSYLNIYAKISGHSS